MPTPPPLASICVATTQTPCLDVHAANSDLVQRMHLAECGHREKDLRIASLEARIRELEGGTVGQSCLSDGGGSVDEEMDAAIRKSEALLCKMSALDGIDEPEMQWAAMMAANEDYKDRLVQIESLVQRRIDQLKMTSDPEVRLCRAVRGLCIGSQRTTPRRWSVSSACTS
eukprot:TRINITY_DN23761_c0_g1_i1.p1 TRINITY_DN23761_c0_g1~~TRINITY_DN23761_c0_g1_i1.p1  ORF type:complete len:171 (-),score=34.70 TRINITY_DN23761_c0_g1_i1:174-686(-)